MRAVFFLTIIFVLLAFNAECKLKFLLTFHRHGARNPNKLHTYVKDIFGDGEADLTDLGRKQLYDLGKLYRERYVLNQSDAVRDFFPKELNAKNSKDFFVLCSPKKRTKESFYSFYNGLFNGSESVKLKEIQIAANYEYSKKEVKKETDLLVRVSRKEYDDLLFHGQKEDECKKAKAIGKRMKTIFAAKEALANYKKIVGPAIMKEVKEKLKINCTEDDIGYCDIEKFGFKEISSILDLYTSALEHNKLPQFSDRIPTFSDEILSKIKEAKIFYRYDVQNGDDFLPRIASATTFRIFSQLLNLRFKQNEESPKWVEMSGHDTNIAAFLKVLLTDEEFRALTQEQLLIPYASHMEFEVHQENNEEPQVRFIYNEQELKLSKCGHPCFLNRFLDLLRQEDIENTDLVKLCNGDSNEYEDHYVAEENGKVRYFPSFLPAKIHYNKQASGAAIASPKGVIATKEKEGSGRLISIGHLALRGLLPVKERQSQYTVISSYNPQNDRNRGFEDNTIVKEFNNRDEALAYYNDIKKTRGAAVFEKGALIFKNEANGADLYSVGTYQELDNYFVVDSNQKVSSFLTQREARQYFNSLDCSACLATPYGVLSSKKIRDDRDDTRPMTIGVLVNKNLLTPPPRLMPYTVMWHQADENDYGIKYYEFDSLREAMISYDKIWKLNSRGLFYNGKVIKNEGGFQTFQLNVAGSYLELPEYYVCDSKLEIKSFFELKDAKSYFDSINGSATLSMYTEILSSKFEAQEDRLKTIGFLISKFLLQTNIRNYKQFAVVWHQYRTKPDVKPGSMFKEFDSIDEAEKFYYKIDPVFAKALLNKGQVAYIYGDNLGFQYVCIGAYHQNEGITEGVENLVMDKFLEIKF